MRSLSSNGGRLNGKRALITGASSGIGAAIAKAYAREGAAVAMGAFSGVERARKLAREINDQGGHATVVIGDVASRADTDRIVDEAEAAFSGLDILVHNAGIDALESAPVAETSDEFWDRCMAIHLTAGFRLFKRALPALLRGKGPSVLFIGSVAGSVAWEGDVAYNVAKAGLHHLARCIALDYSKRGLRANCIAPGVIDTPLTRAFAQGMDKTEVDRAMSQLAAMHPVGRYGTVDEVTGAAVFLASDEASFVTGVILHVDGGFTMV
jgi:NAD(P)-dependent dehydrogenase (short-subunit alcohol dehydrogenase family)